ncbi:hypothetical protein PHYPSEUDO_000781 [Phytophthora pseudosyringae]|uniref:CCZ1/INTU/HPS4 third Longin domain-containing protein n=1 Tax=Phytophthora pseudosyringae TaxID=221518 RepID=A0A8T1WKA2_9STRA|nr:hypothetical protein PHYPSEUDO_000781 [Phytophthora pseudosyringae]
MLLWHEALGSDDEQAAEDELCARVLYSREDREDGERLLQSLHLVQGLLAFVRVLRRSSRDAGGAERAPEWTSVTLSKRRFFVLEVEPQIFMALGVHPTVEIKDHRPGYEALLREMYGMFRLFHGSIDSNLRALPCDVSVGSSDVNGTQLPTKKYIDGMDLLMDIAATRKRLRKLRLAIDSHIHDLSSDEGEKRDDNVLAQLQEEKLIAEAMLEALVAQSPASILRRKCAELFPTLLHALDARGSSGFSELQGLGYFPMDQPTFLALQTFVNGFHTELRFPNANVREEIVESSALFYKGNLLWSSMEAATMHLLYKFLRLREERGMSMLRGDENRDFEEPYADLTPSNNAGPELWMAGAYEDTFLPVWSSKLSYAECNAVSQAEDGPPHLQAPPSTGGGNVLTPSSTPRSGIAAASSPVGSPSHSPASSARYGGPRSNGASPARSKNAMKARARSISFRNAGLLLKNGRFSKLLHANREKSTERSWGETEAVWSPLVFPLDGAATTTAAAAATVARNRVAVWHEADLTMLILLRLNKTELDSTDTAPRGLKAATLERLEDYLEGQQRFQNLAQLIFTRYNATFAPEKNVPTLHPLPPFLYINRVNLAFRMHHVPRLLKSKEDDLFPVPVKLLAHYFPASTLALVNELHAELHQPSSACNREICVRTRHAGWVLAKKSETSHRELYVFFDSKKVSSVYDLSDSLQMLLHDQFGNVLF